MDAIVTCRVEDLPTVAHVHCMDASAGLPSLPDDFADVTITDPPYEDEAHTKQRRVKRSGGIMEVEPLSFDPMTPELRTESAREIARVTRRWVLVFCQVEAAPAWRIEFERAGLVYKRTCIWVKPDGMPQYSGDRPGMGYETIVAMHRPGRSAWNGGGRNGVFVHNKNENPRTGHPTQKPIRLMAELVDLFSDPGEIVLDPFAGSGTTGVACAQLGRRFLGFELDEHWAQLADRRSRGAAWSTSNLDLFDGHR